jgi:membrane-associated phospholipid phosphatase
MSSVALTASLAAASLGVSLLPSASTPAWQSPILFDSPVRSAFRAETLSGRKTAAGVSDVLLYSSILAPALVKGVRSDWRDVQWAANAFFATNLLTQATKKIAARERPAAMECRVSGTCDGGSEPTASFFSGHSSTAFTMAGLFCSPRFREVSEISERSGPWFCGVGAGVAATTAVLRVVADKHFASDILAGAGVGFASGHWLSGLFFAEEGAQAAVFPVVENGGGRGLAFRLGF